MGVTPQWFSSPTDKETLVLATTNLSLKGSPLRHQFPDVFNLADSCSHRDLRFPPGKARVWVWEVHLGHRKLWSPHPSPQVVCSKKHAPRSSVLTQGWVLCVPGCLLL